MASCFLRLPALILKASAGREAVGTVAPSLSALSRPSGQGYQKGYHDYSSSIATPPSHLRPLPLDKKPQRRPSCPYGVPPLSLCTHQIPPRRDRRSLARWLKALSYRLSPARPSPLHLIRWSLLHAHLTAKPGAPSNLSSPDCIDPDSTHSSPSPVPMQPRETSNPAGTSSSTR